MASRIFSNELNGIPLTTLVQETIRNSETLDFLVGYFYFSGFEEIYETIGDRPLRILIGMDADVDARNLIQEYSTYNPKSNFVPSIQSVQDNWIKNCANIINKADLVDTKENQDAYKFFKQKLLDGTLEVRKTKDPNHAKMYLFSLPSEQQILDQNPGKVIIGSSNFSYSGFRSRNEINVFLQDSHDYNDAREIFESLWMDSIPLISKDNAELATYLKKHTWLEKIPSPYLLYIRTLHEYFKESTDVIKTPSELTRDRTNKYFDLDYQTDAIREGVYTVKRHSGVIIADVVGLGKSIIAASIAANLDLNVVIITPPHLKQQWQDYSADFGLKGCQIFTSGKLEEAATANVGNENLTIIIDEAHRYRNEDTESYGYLHQLCAGNKVILLSATPFNNKPEDLFSLIKLFQIPGHSTIQTVDDLGKHMAKLIAEHKALKTQSRKKELSDFEFKEKSKWLAKQIRMVLDPIVIRRTRIDLEKLDRYQENLKAQNIYFSLVNPPCSQEYDLGDLAELYSETLDLLINSSVTSEKDKTISHRSFTGARYKPLTYLVNNKAIRKKYEKYFEVHNFQLGQRNLASFMQQLFVRRFESAKYSFILLSSPFRG